MKAVLYPIAALSLLGLLASAAVHVMSLFGVAPPEAAWSLHVGIFAVWLPTVLVSGRLTRDYPRKDLWKAALRGAPKWMQVVVKVLFVYAIVNFLIFMLSVGAQPDQAAEARGFSGHWMAFYSVAAVTLYSAANVDRVHDTRRCAQGHPVSATAAFCEQCGSPVINDLPVPSPGS